VERLLVAVAIAIAVALLAWLLERRRPEAPTQRRWAVPDQLDRADFERPGAPWLVAVFSSATCDSCAETVDRARVLASADVVVQEVEVGDRGDLHRRYNVEAVPTLVVADREGVVRASFVGPPPEAELAAAIAGARGVET
jgi:protein-disulfide isomerase